MPTKEEYWKNPEEHKRLCKEYKKKNKDKIKQQQKKYNKIRWEQNREKLLKQHHKWYIKNRERILKYTKNYYNKPENIDKKKISSIIYRQRHPEREKAHQLAKYIKINKNSKCEICGSNKFLHRHHKDYNKPLEVNVLCRDCHNQIHQKYKEIE